MADPRRSPLLRALGFLSASPLILRDEFGAAQMIETLDTRRERELVYSAIAESGKEIHTEHGVATVESLRTLVTKRVRALHFSGHGLPEGLAFEDDRGCAHLVPSSTLRKLFAAGGTRDVEFVFVSACHSQSAGEAFAEAGVPHVVAVRWDAKVSDNASSIFSRQFYLALMVGNSVQQAFDIAKELVAASPKGGSLSDDKFLLLPLGGDHDVCIFSDVPPGELHDHTKPYPPNTCDAASPYFLGRNMQLQEIYSLLSDGARFITVCGEEGIGKSACVARACDYITERRLFEGGIFFLRVEELPMDAAAAPLSVAIASAMGEVVTGDEELFDFLRDRHVLLVLDGVDRRLEEDAGYRKFLGALLRRTQNVSVLATSRSSCGPLPHVGEKVVKVAPLAAIFAATLFTALAPRRLKLAEMGVVEDGAKDALQCLADSPVIRTLRGHPRAIAWTAPYLEAYSLGELEGIAAEQYREATKIRGDRPLGLPAHLALTPRDVGTPTAGDGDTEGGKRLEFPAEPAALPMRADWATVQAEVLRKYETATAKAPVRRALTPENLAFLAGKYENCDGVPKFFAWFDSVLSTVVQLQDIFCQTDPVLVHAFIRKGDAERSLRLEAAGTFIIRFSESKDGWLAVAFVDECIRDGVLAKRIQHCLIQVRNSGFVIFFARGAVNYATLPDLVMNCRKLVYLYPRVPKRGAFRRFCE